MFSTDSDIPKDSVLQASPDIKSTDAQPKEITNPLEVQVSKTAKPVMASLMEKKEVSQSSESLTKLKFIAESDKLQQKTDLIAMGKLPPREQTEFSQLRSDMSSASLAKRLSIEVDRRDVKITNPSLTLEEHETWKTNVDHLNQQIGFIGSQTTAHKLMELDINSENPLGKLDSELIARATDIIARLEEAETVENLHDISSSFPELEPDSSPNEKTMRLQSTLKTFIQFTVGLKSIDILFAGFPDEHHIIKEFYKDEHHPMDVQRFFRDRLKAIEVANVIKNLSSVIPQLDVRLTKILENPSNQVFNQYISQLIALRPKQTTPNLLDILTKNADVEGIRTRNGDYYQSIGLDAAFIAMHLSFSTEDDTRGIYLYPKDEEPAEMERLKTHKDSSYVYLRVPDADNRVVRISKEGFEALHEIQVKNAMDLIQIQNRLSSLFGSPIIVTSRTKSSNGILDKTGRLCKKTQEGSNLVKYQTIQDIIDINGVRITCQNSTQIDHVIQTLKSEGFEFLELDNKYNTIRKDGAYKVIPTTIRDTQTGAIFELQITTLPSTSLSDISHNVIYKKEAIGLNVTEEQRTLVLKTQRISALVETLNIFHPIASFSQSMDLMQLTHAAMALNNGVSPILTSLLDEEKA